MRLWIFSDLHLDVNSEFPFALPNACPAHDVVVIAGDLCEGMARGVRWIAAAGLDAKPVIYVGGNHEFYDHDRLPEVAAAREAAKAFPNIHVLEGDSIEIGGKTFLGATLWTDYELTGDRATAMGLAERYMSDHLVIRHGRMKWTAADALAEHVARRRWLTAVIATVPREDVVVVSHHAPSPRSCSTRFRGHPLNASFASDLGLLVGRAGTWVHGHTHTAVDYVQDGCRVINNPRGYVRRESTGFEANLVIDI